MSVLKPFHANRQDRMSMQEVAVQRMCVSACMLCFYVQGSFFSLLWLTTILCTILPLSVMEYGGVCLPLVLTAMISSMNNSATAPPHSVDCLLMNASSDEVSPSVLLRSVVRDVCSSTVYCIVLHALHCSHCLFLVLSVASITHCDHIGQEGNIKCSFVAKWHVFKVAPRVRYFFLIFISSNQHLHTDRDRE